MKKTGLMHLLRWWTALALAGCYSGIVVHVSVASGNWWLMLLIAVPVLVFWSYVLYAISIEDKKE